MQILKRILLIWIKTFQLFRYLWFSLIFFELALILILLDWITNYSMTFYSFYPKTNLENQLFLTIVLKLFYTSCIKLTTFLLTVILIEFYKNNKQLSLTSIFIDSNLFSIKKFLFSLIGSILANIEIVFVLLSLIIAPGLSKIGSLLLWPQIFVFHKNYSIYDRKLIKEGENTVKGYTSIIFGILFSFYIFNTIFPLIQNKIIAMFLTDTTINPLINQILFIITTPVFMLIYSVTKTMCYLYILEQKK